MYRLVSPEGFSDIIRQKVLQTAGLSNDESRITNRQVLNILEMLCVRDDGELLVSDEIVSELMDEAKIILLGVMLSEMASSGELESAWDSEKNEAVFWIPVR
jgi:hypothetical protein